MPWSLRVEGATRCPQACRAWLCPPRAPRRSIPIVDQYFLNPFEKWLRYGRFPWTFAIHIALAILVTAQAMLFFERDVRHVSRTTRHFTHLFVGDSLSGKSSAQALELHSPQELQTAFSRAVNHHFFINNVSIVNYELADPDGLQVQTTWRDRHERSYFIDKAEYVAANGTQSHKGEAYFQEVVPFLYDLELLPQLALLSMDHSLYEKGHHSKCVYRWNVRTTFDGREAGEFKASVSSQASDCQSKEWQSLHALSLAVVALASVSAVLILRKLLRSVGAIHRLKALPEAWQKLTCQDIASLFSPWWGLSLLAHLAQLVSCGGCLQLEPDISHRFRGLGVSCFLTWLNISQYFESFPGFYYAFHTMSISAGGVLRFLLSVFPLFYGFILLGVCLFWQSPIFSTPYAASASLFSLLNGDMLHDTFQEVYFVSGFFGHLYLYVFLMLFIFVILNVNIGIVTDAYEKTKKHPQRENLRALRLAAAREADDPSQTAAGSAARAAALAAAFASPGSSPPSSPIGSPELRPSSPPFILPPPRSNTAPLPQGAAAAEPPPLGATAPGQRRRGSIQYMTPRYYASRRIQEALAAAFPERPASMSPTMAAGHASFGGGPSRLSDAGGFNLGAAGLASGASYASGHVGSSASGLDAALLAGIQGSLVPSGNIATVASGGREVGTEALELSAWSRGWEDFDRGLENLQTVARALQRTLLPGCGEGTAGDVATAVEGLQRAVQVVAAARAKAGQEDQFALPPAEAGAH